MTLVLLALLAGPQDYEKLAPYSGVRWVESAPEIEIEGAWVTLLEIDGAAASDIVAFAKKTWSGRWKKRFEEDLVEVLSKMGKPPGATVTLKVRDAKGERTLEGVAMTKENRRRIREAAKGPRMVSRADAASDLDALKTLIDEKYSYATRREVKYAAAIDAAKAKLPESIPVPAFALEVERILLLFQDGHTGVDGEFLAEGYLPFLVAEAEGRVVAFRADRSGFQDAEHPFVESIDGVEIGKWLEAAGRFTAIPSRRNRTLRFASHLRVVLGLPEKAPLKIVLASAKGETRVLEAPLAPVKPVFGEWPRTESRVLEGNIGYLRIESMDDRTIDLKPFEKTKGLVIDARGNAGGSRAVLRALFPYFMKPSETPRVANVAASRIPGSMDDRWLFPAARLAEPERQAVRNLDFKPEWTPPEGKFGEWHYFILSPGGAPFHYDRPVVVLQDGDCFSATDIFLGAFKGWRNVTLMGTRSGGGSGRTMAYPLTASGLVVRLSSMVSFRSDGKLYDGRGVEPDVEVQPAATDLIGTTDTVLDAAVKRLRK